MIKRQYRQNKNKYAKMSTEKTKSAGADLVTKVVTDKVRFSYVHVFEPTSMEESTDKKYSVSIIISKKNKTLIEKIKKAVAAAAELGKTKKFGGKIPTVNFKNPLRDGDIDRSEDTAFEDSYFITASSKTKPGLVDKDLNPVMDQGEIYSGC